MWKSFMLLYLCLFLSAIWAFWSPYLLQPIFYLNPKCKACTDILEDEPSDYHSKIYFMRSQNIVHFPPQLYQKPLISSCWKSAHCSFDVKDRAFLFSFKSVIGGWRAKSELSFIILPCQKDTTLCKRNDREHKKMLSSPCTLSYWHTDLKWYYSFALPGRLYFRGLCQFNGRHFVHLVTSVI